MLINGIAIFGIALSSCAVNKYSYAPAQTAPTQVASAAVVTKPRIEGTSVPGESLVEKLDWLVRNAESHKTYIVEVTADENIAPRTLQYTGAINITVVLRGDNINRTIRLSSNGRMFTVRQNVTFILDNNITLQGHSQNTDRLVAVIGGIFKMNDGATISGNTGGGVSVSSGSFEMTGGTISGNTASNGGGVNGGFTMSGGIISDNTATKNGGGVFLDIYGGGSTFRMTGGVISGNKANKRGGGVYLESHNGNSFSMRDGNITGNTAAEYGGGVYMGRGNFTKTGGTITGYNSDQSNGNKVADYSGVIARRGHAVYIDGRPPKRKETTAGTRINLSGQNAANWDE